MGHPVYLTNSWFQYLMIANADLLDKIQDYNLLSFSNLTLSNLNSEQFQ